MRARAWRVEKKNTPAATMTKAAAPATQASHLREATGPAATPEELEEIDATAADDPTAGIAAEATDETEADATAGVETELWAAGIAPERFESAAGIPVKALGFEPDSTSRKNALAAGRYWMPCFCRIACIRPCSCCWKTVMRGIMVEEKSAMTLGICDSALAPTGVL